jgi:hypothetical protein
MSVRRKKQIEGQFVYRLIEMLRSPAYRVLSRAAHQVLARFEIELAAHGGKDNGNLIVTFAQFTEYGLHRKAIAPAVREATNLGFVEVTEQGRGGNAEWRRPSKYRLTYLPTEDAPPTHEWRRITNDDAAIIAAGARRPGTNSPGPESVPKAFQKPGPESVLKPGPESVPKPRAGKRTEGAVFPGRKSVPLSRCYPSTQPTAAPAQHHPTSTACPKGGDHWADLRIPEFSCDDE